MSKVRTFSRYFPAYHPKAGQETHFIEKIQMSLCLNTNELASKMEFRSSPKHHTIRGGKPLKIGDTFSPRYWNGVPYQKHKDQAGNIIGPAQTTFAPDITVVQWWKFDLVAGFCFLDDKRHCHIHDDRFLRIAKNDGLDVNDLLAWFKYPAPIKDHQIICWSNSITY